MKVGIRELARTNGMSFAQAFAWDLENNNIETIDFQVEHAIKLRNGTMKKITDPREIYELVANYGQRRKRAAVLRLIPGDIIDMAVEVAQQTLEKAAGMDLEHAIPKMLTAFADEFAVTQDMIEKRVGHLVSAISPTEMVSLKSVYRSLKDGMSKPSDHFDFGDQPSEASERASGLEAAIKGEGQPKEPEAPKETAKKPEAKPAQEKAPAKPKAAEKPAEAAQEAPDPEGQAKVDEFFMDAPPPSDAA
jgi:hypothetical protein